MRIIKSWCYRYLVPLSAALVFIVLLGVSIIGTWYISKNQVASIIHNDIKKLAEIFTQIDQTCGIVDFEYQQNPINFLNVGTFAGSEVGPMNLQYPDQWKGPYLKDNFTVQEKEYMVVRTKHGYFITPGNGVCLPNKKCIGTDIQLLEDANIDHMLNTNLLLKYGNYKFAAHILPHKISRRGAVPISEDQ